MFSNQSRAAKIVALAMNARRIAETKYNESGFDDDSNIPSTSKESKILMDFDSDDSVNDQDYLPDLSTESRCNSIDSNIMQTNNLCPDLLEQHYDPENLVLVNNPEKQFSRKLKKERKVKRSTGKEYVNVTGNIVRKKKMLPLENCRLKCKERIPDITRQILFEEYWSLADNSKQRAYLANLIDTVATKVTRKRDNILPQNTKNRSTTNIFHFKIKGERIKVCRCCFVNTYDVSQMFVTNTIKKSMSSVSGVPQQDRRGLASSNKHSYETISFVVQHILSFPSYESHYTRRTSNKKYLPSYLNLQKMYSLYREQISNPVSRKIYSREFHKLNLSFKIPQVDTCNTCDTLNMKIGSESILEQKEIFENELKQHHINADTAYDTKKKDKKLAQDSLTLKTFAFDLQQCLPTPYLNTSVAFYKRQLWTYNLTTHSLGNEDVKCYMWHEAEGGRGANQIATVLYEELINLSNDINLVILYSDTCGGQNKNSHVSAMFLCLMQHKPSLRIIDHKFLVSGHSHMECDIDHELIEKQKKNTEYPISYPYDWFQLVRTVGEKKKFVVKEMRHDQFFDYASLLKSELVLRKKDTDNSIFKWHKAKWLRYTKTPGEISFKTSLQDSEPFKILSLIRRGDPNPKLEPKKLYSSTLPISKEKKKDLLSLLPLIRPEFHEFYEKLKVSNSVQDMLPDIEGFEEEE